MEEEILHSCLSTCGQCPSYAVHSAACVSATCAGPDGEKNPAITKLSQAQVASAMH